MIDDYLHSDSTIMYVEENIPGPSEDSLEYENLITKFNSQLTESCGDVLCLQETCRCLNKSGGMNYELRVDGHSPEVRLNFNKISDETLSKPVIECNSLCKCSQNCSNRLVQKGPIKCLFVDKCLMGKGLFTDRFIPKGAFICEYAGEVITRQQAQMRQHVNDSKEKMNYIFCLNEYSNNLLTQMIVDPSFFGNIGRYINHSCEPNCFIIPVRFESPLPKLAIFSMADILANSQITFDYGSHNLSNPKNIDRRKRCLCGSKICRGFLPYEECVLKTTKTCQVNSSELA